MIVTVFGASKIQEEDTRYASAKHLGALLAGEGHTVCTGGYKGIMTAVSQGAKEAGGQTIGITTTQFPGHVNPYVDEVRQYPTWNERLMKLIETGEAYIVLDGGTGTLVELFVTWEMTNKKMLQKPILILGTIPTKLLEFFKSEPLVISNDYLKSVESPEEAVKALHVKAC